MALGGFCGRFGRDSAVVFLGSSGVVLVVAPGRDGPPHHSSAPAPLSNF